MIKRDTEPFKDTVAHNLYISTTNKKIVDLLEDIYFHREEYTITKGEVDRCNNCLCPPCFDY